MRSPSLFGGFALAALAGLTAAARAEPYDATLAAETDVRCGPGDSAMYYPTNHLHVGDRVRVVKDADGGWLAIVPPTGSFSWIRNDTVKPLDDKQPRILMVDAEAADVRVGSALMKGPPLVVGKRVVRGTQLTPLPNYEPKTDGEGTWIPVYPPAGEVRYVRADAIKQPAPVAAGNYVATVPAGSNAAPGQDAESIYRRAIDAEKFNPQDAVALYTQGANADANADRRIQALNRANWLRENLRNPAQTIVPGPTPGADVRTAGSAGESRVYPMSADPAVRLSPPQGSATAASTASVTMTTTAPPVAPAGANEYSTQPGWLRRSGRTVEGRKTYVMTDSKRGLPFYYVTAEPGVDLDGQVNQYVECFGAAVYNGDLRANYMRVSRVESRSPQP